MTSEDKREVKRIASSEGGCALFIAVAFATTLGWMAWLELDKRVSALEKKLEQAEGRGR